MQQLRKNFVNLSSLLNKKSLGVQKVEFPHRESNPGHGGESAGS